MNTPDTSRPTPETLTPARTVYVYALAFFLMLFLDASRSSTFMEQLGVDFPPAAIAGQAIRTVATVSGLSALSRTETALVDRFTFERTLGAVPAPPSSSETASKPTGTVSSASLSATKPTTNSTASKHVPDFATLPTFGSDPRSDAQQPSESTNKSVAPDLTPHLKEQGVERSSPSEPKPSVSSEPAAKPRVLLIGDSMMMEGFGPVLQRTLRKRTDMEVIREGRYSTGLSRMDYFDWPTCLQELMVKYNPDIVVICMGANDPQDIIDTNKKRHHADSESWQKIYQTRAERLLEIATARGSNVIWMGLPIMSKEPYATRVKRLTRLQKAACDQNERAQFVDSSAVLADNKGAYTTFVTDAQGKHVRLRYKDMVHVTEDGGRLLTTSLVPYIEKALRGGRDTIDSADADATPTTLDTTPDTISTASTGAVKHSEPSEGGLTSDFGTIPLAPLVQLVPTQTAVPSLPQQTVASLAENDTVTAVQERQPRRLRVTSTLRGKEVPYLAYIPVSRPTGTSAVRNERFPVLYLLHGAYEDYDVWDKRAGTLLLELADRYRIIIVAPSCEAFGWYVDSPLVPSSRIESFILTELMPHVEKNLPVLPLRGAAGMSMGGHGAFALGLRHPGTFASLSSMSGVMDITRHPDQWKIKTVLGPLPANRALWNGYSAQYLLAVITPAEAPAMLVTAGANDKWIIQENRDFRDALRKQGFTYQYRESPGGHDWNYWMSELPQHVAFHAARLR